MNPQIQPYTISNSNNRTWDSALTLIPTCMFCNLCIAQIQQHGTTASAIAPTCTARSEPKIKFVYVL